MSQTRSGEGRCDSCGRLAEPGDEPLLAVHRVYITPEAWDSPGRIDTLDDVEHWCFVCRTHYPHEEVTPLRGEPEGGSSASPPP